MQINPKSLFAILMALAIAFLPISLSAEEPEEREAVQTVITQIEAESEGNVTFEIPDDLENLILNPNPEKKQAKPTGPKAVRPSLTKEPGYRIQVFNDGRNPATLEARAKARGSQIIARFAKYRGQVYTYSSSPNWVTRIGNFKTSGEAQEALGELQRAFPQFRSEMRVVKCMVTIKQ